MSANVSTFSELIPLRSFRREIIVGLRTYAGGSSLYWLCTFCWRTGRNCCVFVISVSSARDGSKLPAESCFVIGHPTVALSYAPMFFLSLAKKVNICLASSCLRNSQAEQGLSFDSTELHEYSYTFFANLAKVLEEDMGVHVERLAPHLLKEIQVSHVDGQQVCSRSYIMCEEYVLRWRDR